MADVLLNIGSRGLAASHAALATVSHNVANASTPGYSRQEAVLASAGGAFEGGRFFGRGVEVAEVRRSYDRFLAAAVQSAASASAADAARADGLQQLDALFADADLGLGAALDDITGAAADLASHPADGAARQVFLARAAQFADRVRTFGRQVEAMTRQADARLANDARSVNQHVETVRSLNAVIAARSTEAAPNDLLDARDAAVQSLQALMAVQVLREPGGGYTLLAASGQPLLVGPRAYQLEAAQDPADPSRLALRLAGDTGARWLDAADLGGGRLAGTLTLRDQDLAAAGDALGRLAAATAQAFNAAHAQGVDAAGAAGQPLFEVPAPAVRGHAENRGAAAVGVAVTDALQWRASAYDVSWDGTEWSVCRLSDGQVRTGALPLAVDGFSFSVAGSPQAGDRWRVQPFAAAATGLAARPLDASQVAAGAPGAPVPAGDNRNALALAKVANGVLLDGGSLPQAWAGLLAEVGHRTQAAEAAADVSRRLQSDAQSRQQALAGVDLDEEAADLLRHQQVYQACARIVQASQSLFEALLSATGR